MSQDEGSNAAKLIATDPAFSALEASGAPILAIAGEPLRVVYANGCAKAVFGDDPGERLLARDKEAASGHLIDIIEAVRNGAAPRLERLPITIGDGARTVTILCRRLSDQDAEAIFVVAALGLRATAAPAATLKSVEAAKTEFSDEQEDAGRSGGLDAMSDGAARARLLERHGEIAPRFLWKTDAAGRFVDVTHVLSDVAGAKNADLLGREIGELSRALGLGPAFAAALATRKSWSGVEVDWPIEEPLARAPTTLGALPIHDAGRRFVGFQGYGVIRLAEAVSSRSPEAAPGPSPDVSLPASATVAAEACETASSPREAFSDGAFPANNVVALRSAAPPREPAKGAVALSPQEQSAFDEIARTLNFSALPSPPAPGHARELIDHIGRAIGGAAPSPRALGAAGPSLPPAFLIDRLPIGVLVARGSEALYANRTLLDYLGYEDLDQFAAAGGLTRLFLGRAPQSFAPPTPPSGAVEIRAQDGETLCADAHFQIVGWDGEPATLISFRRHHAPARQSAEETAARALARSQARELSLLRVEHEAFAACFEANPTPIAIVSRSGRIEKLNPAFAALLGAEAEQQELNKFMSGPDARRLAGVFSPSAGRAAEEEGLSFDRVNLGAHSVRITLKSLGEPSRLLCFATSLPSQEARPDADTAREEAERANAAKSAFLARMSHEIRTPLNAIIGFAEVMMEERFGPIGSERYKEYLKDVHTSGVHVLSLVNDLLDLSKIEAGKLELVVEEVDVNAVIGECVSIMQTQSNQQRVVMRLSLSPRLPRIRADERSLRQILLNLLSNAVKFSEAGGQVIVSSALTDAGYVVIRVIDTGIGMSDDEIQVALEPFRQVANSRNASGTGLGLPVTKALIEANNASFLIKSRKNEGTLVEVAFPATPGLAAE
jgi:signal transduction histidine kinase